MNAPELLKTAVIVGDFADFTGGQAKVAIDSARLLADAGVEVIFFAASGPVNDVLNHPNITTVCLFQDLLIDDAIRSRAALAGIWNRRALRRLREVLAPLSVDSTVVHCHGWAKALSPSIGLALTDSAFATLYTMHEYFLACPNGGFLNYRTGKHCELTPLSLSCCTTHCDVRQYSHKIWRLARTFVARSFGQIPSGLRDIVFLSETQRKVMEPYLDAETRLYKLPNPVSAGGPKVNFRDNERLLFIGRLSPEKGATIFAEACRRTGFPATFVGDGTEAARIREILPDAQITGWLPPKEVQRHLSEARAVVFPSIWYECQPLVPIEAQLRGIPVVCGSWSAASETVRHGESGIIYDASDPDTLAQALFDLQTIEPFDTEALARTASPQAHLKGLLEIYNGLLSRRHAAAADAGFGGAPDTAR